MEELHDLPYNYSDLAMARKCQRANRFINLTCNRYYTKSITSLQNKNVPRCTLDVLQSAKNRIRTQVFGFGNQMPDLRRTESTSVGRYRTMKGRLGPHLRARPVLKRTPRVKRCRARAVRQNSSDTWQQDIQASQRYINPSESTPICGKGSVLMSELAFLLHL